MYLLDFPIFIKQLLPPSWRNTWIESLAYVLSAPLGGAWLRFGEFRRKTRDQININGQVLTLEYHLGVLANVPQSSVRIVGDARRGYFTIFIPRSIELDTLEKLRKFVDAHKIAGSGYEFCFF